MNTSTRSGDVRWRRVEPRERAKPYEIQAQPAANELAGTKPRTREVFFEVWGKQFSDPDVSGWVI